MGRRVDVGHLPYDTNEQPLEEFFAAVGVVASRSTTDGDFARFPGLKWENPLAA